MNMVNKIVVNSRRQFPFRQKDVLTGFRFIQFCNDFQIRTTIKELEEFDKQNLLIPVLKIKRDVVELVDLTNTVNLKTGKKGNWLVEEKNLSQYQYGKQSAQKVYMFEDIDQSSDNWLDTYIQQERVVYPAQEPYEAWKYLPQYTYSFSEVEIISKNSWQPYFSKLQIYLSYSIQNKDSKNKDDLYKTPGGWVQLPNFDFQRIASLINELSGMWDVREIELKKETETALYWAKGGNENLQELTITDKERVENIVSQKFKEKAQEIILKHNITVQELEAWRLYFLGFGSFRLPSTARLLRKKYLESIDEKLFAQTEYPYVIVSMLNWLIKLTDGKPMTIKELLLGDTPYKFCPYCKSYFIPQKSRKDWKTCGSKYCILEHRKKTQREGRKSGKYQ